MTRNYCIESLESQLSALNLPFANIFARALCALLTGRKISLQHVVNLMPGEQSSEANRQQIRRCLNHQTMQADIWAKAIEKLLPDSGWVLALDRTEWRRGDTTVNLLVLAVVVSGCAVPLLWTVLPRCGNSDTKERKELLLRFLALFGRNRIQYLTADREFIGRDWTYWLLLWKIPFRIRIKANEYLMAGAGGEKKAEKKAEKWFENRACRCKPKRMCLWGLWVFVGGKRLPCGSYLIVISNEASDDLWEDYKVRWKIETLFQAMKGRGFDLESCRLSEEKRLSGWFGFLSLGLCWCLKVGQMLERETPLPRKKHGRRAISVFQRGLRQLQKLLAPLSGCLCRERFSQAIAILRPEVGLEIGIG